MGKAIDKKPTIGDFFKERKNKTNDFRIGDLDEKRSKKEEYCLSLPVIKKAETVEKVRESISRALFAKDMRYITDLQYKVPKD